MLEAWGAFHGALFTAGPAPTSHRHVGARVGRDDADDDGDGEDEDGVAPADQASGARHASHRSEEWTPRVVRLAAGGGGGGVP